MRFDAHLPDADSYLMKLDTSIINPLWVQVGNGLYSMGVGSYQSFYNPITGSRSGPARSALVIGGVTMGFDVIQFTSSLAYLNLCSSIGIGR
jgi:hypothetical protein